ncbi:MAG: RNA polymerase sigma factor [Gemmatimonadota bacterium]
MRKELSGKSDHQLMTAVGLGDVSALGLLFERHSEGVYSLCYRMTGDGSVADDLVQESFLRIHRYSSRFEGRAAFSTWLYRLVRNVCLDHLNAVSRAQARTETLSLISEPGHTPGGDDEVDPRVETLRQALYGLSAGEREVLVLSRYEGLSYAEIAEVCETTVGAIKVRAHRAMRALRKRFTELEQAI